MKQFFKFLLATILGIALSVFLLVIILVSIAGLSDQPVKINPNSVLHIKLDSRILDYASDSPFENFDKFSGDFEEQLGLKKDILDNLKKAKTDNNIKGILLELQLVDAGIATLDEIRTALIDFKTSGKFIYAYSELYTQKAYFLSSVADSVFIYPEGLLEFRGLSVQIAFFKGLLEKLEVEPQIIRGKNNKFKSAVEPFFLDKMSAASREQTARYAESIWNHFLGKVSESRSIPVNQLKTVADSLWIRTAEDAVKFRLADAVIYKDELLDKLKERTGEKGEKIKFVNLKKYTHAGLETEEDDEDGRGRYKKDKIAVIYAQGGIESGKGDHETIGSDQLSESIRKARQDEKVKAIVLRVNSPGGSALASDVIWREMGLAKQAKPVIVSMGDVAASGGYYIACNADTIVASPVTITGSIGVFGVLPNAQKFFNNKLGVTFDGVKTNKYADIGNITRSLNAEEFNIIQQQVDDIYNDFIGKVAEGRKISKVEVDSIGQGRVWSGEDAKKLGLTDEFGGIDKAIEIAAARAGIIDYRLSYFPKKEDPFEKIMKELMGEGDEEARIIAGALGANYKYYQQLKSILTMSGAQARMPYLPEVY